MLSEHEITPQDDASSAKLQLRDELRLLLREREALCKRITEVERRARRLERERNALAVRANRLQSRIVELREHKP